MSRFTRESIAGCLLGGAIGDSLGYFIETMDWEIIMERYGAEGLTDFLQSDEEAQVSDDTQLMLYTAVALLYARMKDLSSAEERAACMYQAYLDWLSTQNRRMKVEPGHISWLVERDELHQERRPEDTTFRTLMMGTKGSFLNPANRSTESGCIFRNAPTALFIENPQEAAETAAYGAALTHGGSAAHIAASAYALIINRLLYTDLSFTDALSEALTGVRAMYPHSRQEVMDLTQLLTRAVALAAEGFTLGDTDGGEDSFTDDSMDVADAIAAAAAAGIRSMEENAGIIESLGSGNDAPEALAIAIYCCLRYDEFEDVVAAAANHSGKSDTTAAIAGSISGLLQGSGALPARFIMPMELYDIISATAADLYEGSPALGNNPSDIAGFKEKYYG